ncbi:hypothetical protein CR513_01261, partial [Mucuna pruriens]
MQALEQSGTWELVFLPSSKKAVGCRWVFAIKVGPNGTVDRLKARLVAKGYIQAYGFDYGDTFSPMAKITIIHLLLAMATIRHWPLHQLGIKNAFIHGELDEEIYMEQPPGFVVQGESGLVCKLRRSLYGLKQSPRAWFGKFSQVVQNFRMTRSEANHSTKDLGHLKYFLGIEVAQSKEGIVIFQRKYALDILQETSMSNCRPIDNPMDPNMKLMVKQGDPYSDPKRYIKKTPGQGLLYEDKGDTHISGYCNADWAGSSIDRRSTIGFCTSIGGNVASWKSKKQNTIARSSAEVEYRAMASATCELIWVK